MVWYTVKKAQFTCSYLAQVLTSRYEIYAEYAPYIYIIRNQIASQEVT